MIQQAISKLASGENLSYEIAEAVMNQIMQGNANDIQISAFLTALHIKGETPEEITACAVGMRNHCIHLQHDGDLLEIVGTGGDRSNSFNISTVTALVVSAAGVPVAKHGNRAATSKCGTADCLEALGVDITVPPERSKEILEQIGMCFLFAQSYHTGMKYVMPARKQLGIPTVFNILGPLANPASANMQLLGVYDENLVLPLAEVLMNLGVENGMVVHGKDGLDEISLSDETVACQIKNGKMKSYIISPEQFGLQRCKPEDLVGGMPAENAEIVRAILHGEKGPKRDAVLLNSAAALSIAKPELDWADGLKLAAETIDSGKAMRQLEAFVALSQGKNE